MKIDIVHGKYLDANVYRVKEDKAKKTNTKKENGVSIEISNLAKELADKIRQNDGGVFIDKAAKIRQSIMSGTYKVSSEDIAERILKAIEEQKKGSEGI